MKEFTNYVVKNASASEKGYSAVKHVKIHLFNIVISKYEESELPQDIALDRVEKLKYFPKLDKLAVCERNQVSSFRLFLF